MFQMITMMVIFVIMMTQMTKTHTNVLTLKFKKLPILGSTTWEKSAKKSGIARKKTDAYPLRVYTLSVMNICELCVGSLLPGWLSSLY